MIPLLKSLTGLAGIMALPGAHTENLRTIIQKRKGILARELRDRLSPAYLDEFRDCPELPEIFKNASELHKTAHHLLDVAVGLTQAQKEIPAELETGIRHCCFTFIELLCIAREAKERRGVKPGRNPPPLRAIRDETGRLE